MITRENNITCCLLKLYYMMLFCTNAKDTFNGFVKKKKM